MSTSKYARSGIDRWVAICTLACAVQSAAAADIAAGKAKAAQVCQTCHGMDGRGTQAMVANIGGQQRQYLVKQLNAYRSGEREHAQMTIIARMLTDEDVDNLSEWYSSIVASFEIPQ
jgi:cytochrome c553